MAPPLILRIITDATDVFKTNDAVIASNTAVGRSMLGVGEDAEASALAQVKASLRADEANQTQIASLRELSVSAEANGTIRARAAELASVAELKYARSQAYLTGTTLSSGKAAQTAETDIGKLTRGALAGSGAASSLGRSLAFASSGFIAVAGGATIIAASIRNALSLASTQKQVQTQLATTGKSWGTYGGQIEGAIQKESSLSAFTNQDLLQSFGYLVRVSGNVQQSLKLDAVAADVARGRHIALSSASIALAKALGGSSTALRRLGIIVPKTAEGMAAINYVAQKFAGQAEAGATSADHLKATLTDASEVIGTALLPTFNRLTDHFSTWLNQMEQSGRLERDVNEGVKVMGALFHGLEGVVKRVDDLTGSFAHTLGILVALELAKKVATWVTELRILAETWGLVGAAAKTAGAAQATALTESNVAGAAGGGGLLGRLFGRGTTGVTTRVGLATGDAELAAAGAGGAAAGASATGIGALAVAAVLATSGLDSLAKKLADKFGAGKGTNGVLDDVTGFLTAGLAGNSKFGIPEILERSFADPMKGIIERIQAEIQQARTTPAQHEQQLGITIPDLLGPAPTKSGIFGSAKPQTQFWKSFTLTFREELAQAQASLTAGTADDVAAARQVVARIQGLINQGRLHGQALLQAIGLEASAVSTIQSAEAAAAQKRAAAAQAAAAAAQAAIENSIDPIALQVELAKDQALGRKGDALSTLRKMKRAAKDALASGKLSQQQQLEAWQQIKSLNQQIADALKKTTSSTADAYKQLNTAQLVKGLGLTAAQAKALRARLSQVGPGGTGPRHGTGAYGYDIGANGRPIHVHTTVNLDGKKVAHNTTKHQQKRRRRNSSQSRGPNAGG